MNKGKTYQELNQELSVKWMQAVKIIILLITPILVLVVLVQNIFRRKK